MIKCIYTISPLSSNVQIMFKMFAGGMISKQKRTYLGTHCLENTIVITFQPYFITIID